MGLLNAVRRSVNLRLGVTTSFRFTLVIAATFVACITFVKILRLWASSLGARNSCRTLVTSDRRFVL